MKRILILMVFVITLVCGTAAQAGPIYPGGIFNPEIEVVKPCGPIYPGGIFFL